MAAGGFKVVGASVHLSQIEVVLEWAWGWFASWSSSFRFILGLGLQGFRAKGYSFVLRVRETEEFTNKSQFHGGPNLRYEVK